jgi:uncharacterized protein YjiS (DUF1127 family)
MEICNDRAFDNAMSATKRGDAIPNDGLLATFERWWVTYLTWQLERATIAHLSKLSDRELRDVGLNRSEIPAAVRGAATSPLMTSCN